jgi:soluble cytochrome b562
LQQKNIQNKELIMAIESLEPVINSTKTSTENNIVAELKVAQEASDEKIDVTKVRKNEQSSKPKDKGRKPLKYYGNKNGYTSQSDNLKEFRRQMYVYFDGLSKLLTIGKTEEVKKSLNELLSGMVITTDKTTVEFFRIIDYMANIITPEQMSNDMIRVNNILNNLRDGFK